MKCNFILKIFSAAAGFFICPAICLGSNMGKFDEVKKAVFAGSFYPGSAGEIKKMADAFIAGVPAYKDPAGQALGFIVPHAGYVYSGPAAAFAYKRIGKIKPKTVIIIGPSHRVYFKGISVYSGGFWETPLGLVRVNRELAEKLLASDTSIRPYKEAHAQEHSIEVQIPFLQAALPFKTEAERKKAVHLLSSAYSETAVSDFEIVPIVMGEQNYQFSTLLAEVLAKTVNSKDTIVLAATDLSHFHDKEKAGKLDRKLADLVKDFNVGELNRRFEDGTVEACGQGTILSLMLYAQKLGEPAFDEFILTNSGEASGDYSRGVVGYLSGMVYLKSGGKLKKLPAAEDAKKETGEQKMLNISQKKILLDIARKTIETFLKEKKKPAFEIKDPVLKEINGAFVTLHFSGNLRGCIGNIIGYKPLWETVRDMAVEAATGDTRFLPVTIDEMKHIDIEISVLSPLKKIESPEEIVLGKHGVLVKKGFSSGVFLPQVATETGWNLEEFMSHLCRDKAVLPPEAWKTDKALEIYIYTAEVFSEKELKEKR